MSYCIQKMKDAPLKFMDGDRSSKYPKRSEFQAEGIMFLNANSTSSGVFNIETVNYITQDKYETITKGRIIANDIILTTRGNGVGDSFLFKEKYGEALINAQMLIVRCDDKKLSPQYLYYYFINPACKDNFKSCSSGSAQPQLPIKSLKEIEIKYPPLPTQRKIANILSAYDDLIENNLKRIKLLEEKVFLRYKGIVRSEKTESVKLKDVAVVNESSLKSNSDIEKLLYVDIASVSTGSIENKTEYELKEAPGRAKRILRHQDIIWSCVRPNRKSYSFVWRPEENLIGSTGFAVISAKEIPATFLYQLITTNDFVSYLENHAKGATYPAVTATDFEDATLLICSKNIMDEYHEEVNQLFEMKYVLQKQNTKLREARDLLLPKLMSGQIEV